MGEQGAASVNIPSHMVRVRVVSVALAQVGAIVYYLDPFPYFDFVLIYTIYRDMIWKHSTNSIILCRVQNVHQQQADVGSTLQQYVIVR